MIGIRGRCKLMSLKRPAEKGESEGVYIGRVKAPKADRKTYLKVEAATIKVTLSDGWMDAITWHIYKYL